MMEGWLGLAHKYPLRHSIVNKLSTNCQL